MKKSLEVYKQIAETLAKHFDGLYYVDLESGAYTELVAIKILKDLAIDSDGKDFFKETSASAKKCVHPDDQKTALAFLSKANTLKTLSKRESNAAVYRIVVDGEVTHMRHIQFLCDDKKHIVFCVRNVEKEYRHEEELKKDLKSAELLARLDDLTGIRNKNAFKEHVKNIDAAIKSGGEVQPFGVVMCDVNDLKLTNDTRGHSFGDEILQGASRMICETFKHSPVFRVGGDEFVVILSGSDFKQREKLVKSFKLQSESNRVARTGSVVACGMASYHPDKDRNFNAVFKRADQKMYKNKGKLKSKKIIDEFHRMETIKDPIPEDRRAKLDAMFGAMFTVAGGGYVYLNDMRYDFSRWSLPLINDFGLAAEYMYHADSIWQNYIHPDDVDVYRSAVDAVLCKDAELKCIYYRARKADGSYVLLTTRGFVLNDDKGNPEYFGGIIIPQ